MTRTANYITLIEICNRFGKLWHMLGMWNECHAYTQALECVLYVQIELFACKCLLLCKLKTRPNICSFAYPPFLLLICWISHSWWWWFIVDSHLICEDCMVGISVHHMHTEYFSINFSKHCLCLQFLYCFNFNFFRFPFDYVRHAFFSSYSDFYTVLEYWLLCYENKIFTLSCIIVSIV